MTLDVDIEALWAERPPAPPLILIDHVAFTLPAGRSLGVVGESGSGKTLLALAVIGLLPKNIRAKSRLVLDGVNLTALPAESWEHVRGKKIGMIFQEPMTALNPTMTIGEQVAEGLVEHKGMTRAAARAETLRLLDRVRIPNAAGRFGAFAHQLSGGQRQRVGIAMALAPGPRLLIADEPTTALDVTVQADILDLLNELVAELHMSLIIISHDLGVIAGCAERMLVMYAGTSVEYGPTSLVLNDPRHPYTIGLIAALPRAPSAAGSLRGRRLRGIPGDVPPPGHWPKGCRFVTRCARKTPVCGGQDPIWDHLVTEHAARCFHPGGPAAEGKQG